MACYSMRLIIKLWGIICVWLELNNGPCSPWMALSHLMKHIQMWFNHQFLARVHCIQLLSSSQLHPVSTWEGGHLYKKQQLHGSLGTIGIIYYHKNVNLRKNVASAHIWIMKLWDIMLLFRYGLYWMLPYLWEQIWSYLDKGHLCFNNTQTRLVYLSYLITQTDLSK